MPKRRNFGTEAILKEIYPLVEKALSTRTSQWKNVMSKFMEKRSQSLFDIAPCDRIYYTDFDRDELFTALNLSMNDIRNGLRNTYYWPVSAFNPSQAKDPTTIVVLCIVRYFYLKKDRNLELALVYQAFSGKYYPSIHYGFFRTVAPSKYRHIMEYVINNKLSNKFDIKSKGSVIGAIKSINATWITAYKKQMVDFDDEDITYIIQQLHNRIKSFMKNIASLYYEAYENKEYMSYAADNLPDSEGGDTSKYHLTTNDTFKLQQCIDNTMNRITTTHVEYAICKPCADSNVKVDEVRSIMESILENTANLAKINEYLSIVISSYLTNEEEKRINSAKFVKFVTKPKPNSKDPSINRMKEIVEGLLDDNSVAFRKRKHRVATKQSYLFAFNMYMAITIIKANQNM